MYTHIITDVHCIMPPLFGFILQQSFGIMFGCGWTRKIQMGTQYTLRLVQVYHCPIPIGTLESQTVLTNVPIWISGVQSGTTIFAINLSLSYVNMISSRKPVFTAYKYMHDLQKYYVALRCTPSDDYFRVSRFQCWYMLYLAWGQLFFACVSDIREHCTNLIVRLPPMNNLSIDMA